MASFECLTNMAPFECFPEVHLENQMGLEGARKLLYRVRPTWKDQLIVEEALSSGFINDMRRYSLGTDDGRTDAVVVRVFGTLSAETGLESTEDNVISRANELIGMQIGQATGCFPPIIATFNNGMLYKYARGRCLRGQDLLDPAIIKLLARAFAAFHNFDLDKALVYNFEGRPIRPKEYASYRIFRNLWNCMAKAPASIEDHQRNLRYQQAMDGMHAEIEQLEVLFNELEFDISLCHNDAHFKNILYDDTAEKIWFVDYEMVEMGYSAYDLSMIFAVQEHFTFIGIGDGTDLSEREDLWSIAVDEYLKLRWHLKNTPLDKQRQETDTFMFQFKMLLRMQPLIMFAICASMVKAHNFASIDVLGWLEFCRRKHFDAKSRLLATYEQYKNYSI